MCASAHALVPFQLSHVVCYQFSERLEHSLVFVPASSLAPTSSFPLPHSLSPPPPFVSLSFPRRHGRPISLCYIRVMSLWFEKKLLRWLITAVKVITRIGSIGTISTSVMIRDIRGLSHLSY